MGCRATLGELCTFHRGASVPRARMFNSGNYLYIHYGDLYRGFEQRIDVEDPAKPLPFILDSEKIKETQFLHDQDIVFVLTSETVDDLGHAFLFNNPRNRIAVSGTETTIVRIQRKDMVLPAYLNYVMQSPRFIAELRQYVRGMKVFRVHPNDAARIPIDLPSLDKQAKVVAILDAIFEKRLINNRLNGYLEEACDAIYSSFAADNNFDSGILADLVEVKYGKDHKKLGAGDIPVYGSGGFMRSVNDWLYQGESVLIPRKGSLNNVMFVNEAFWTVDTMFYTVPTCPGAAKYVYQFIKRVNLASMNSGSAVPSMTTDILNSIELPVPGVEQLTQFDSALEPYYSAIRLNRTESSRLADLRDALLPKLMSGEIDVSKVDLTQLNSHLADCLVQPSPEGIPVFHKWPSADQPTEDQLDSP